MKKLLVGIILIFVSRFTVADQWHINTYEVKTWDHDPIIKALDTSCDHANARINEFHYDNTGSDDNEFVEIFITDPQPVDLDTYKITLYNGSNRMSYASETLDNMPATLGSGGVYYIWEKSGIQNGPDAIALSGPCGLIEFLSYEGDFVATGGPADGVMSTDIVVYESNSQSENGSIQLIGSTWVVSSEMNTKGYENFIPCTEPIVSAVLSCDNATINEYFIKVTITNGGTASGDLHVTDGTTTVSASINNLITFGPYTHSRDGRAHQSIVVSDPANASCYSTVIINEKICGYQPDNDGVTGDINSGGFYCFTQGWISSVPAILLQTAPAVQTATDLSTVDVYVLIANDIVLQVNNTGLFENLDADTEYTIHAFNVLSSDRTSFMTQFVLGMTYAVPVGAGCYSVCGMTTISPSCTMICDNFFNLSVPLTEDITICDHTAVERIIIAPTAVNSPAELFFSEYIEGGGLNKCLEIFNGTGAKVDLSEYVIELYSNGSSSVSRSYHLVGSLADDEVFVICHEDALFETPNVKNNVINHNGDDTYALRKEGILIDVIGQIGFDPGTRWSNNGVTTQNRSIKRKANVIRGDTYGNDAFVVDAEWQLVSDDQDDFSDLGRHIITLENISEFDFYAEDGTLLASSVSTFDTLIHADISPVHIGVAAHPSGTLCVGESTTVTLGVHPGEGSMVCGAEYNMAVSEDCSLAGATVDNLFQGMVDPFFLDVRLSTQSGIEVNNDDVSSLFSNQYHQRIIYEIIDSCQSELCWGYIDIERKIIPDTLLLGSDTICCSQELLQSEMMTEEDIDGYLNQFCYAEHRNIHTVRYNVGGGDCDTIREITEIWADFYVHDEKEGQRKLYQYTLVRVPLHSDSIVPPGSMNLLDSIALADTIRIEACDGFDLSPENIAAYWAEKLDQGDKRKNGHSEGLPYAYPYINKGIEVRMDTLFRYSTRDSVYVEKVKIDGVWVHLEVVNHLVDTTMVVTPDTVPLYLPVAPGTCGMKVIYNDYYKANCTDESGILRRSWEVINSCGKKSKRFDQVVIIEDIRKPAFNVLPVDFEMITVDTIVINKMDTFHIAEVDIDVDLDYIVRLEYVENSFDCTADVRIPRFPDFTENCSDYDSLKWSYSFDRNGPYLDDQDPFLIHGMEPGINEVQIMAADDCGNIATHTLIFIVLDKAPPRPQCRDKIHVAINDDDGLFDGGLVRVALSSLDLETVDDCGQILLTLGRRMDNDFFCGNRLLTSVGLEYLEFCCEDLNKEIPVELTFYDNFGNSSKCWSTVVIENKIEPEVYCLEKELNCQSITDDEIRELVSVNSDICNQLNRITIGEPQGPEPCGGNSELVPVYLDSVEYCRIKLSYTAVNPFDPHSIQWPVHYTGTTVGGSRRECIDHDNNPETSEVISELVDDIELPSPISCHDSITNTGMPVWCATDACLFVQHSYEDKYIGGEYCGTLIRQWTVIDWCTYDPGAVKKDSDEVELIDDRTVSVGLPAYSSTNFECTNCQQSHQSVSAMYYRYSNVNMDGLYTYDQRIDIIDTTAPFIIVNDADTILIANSGISKSNSAICSAEGTVYASALDYCHDKESKSKLSWWIEIFEFDNKNNDWEKVDEKYMRGNDIQLIVGEGFPGDRKRIRYSVSDRCGNMTQSESILEFVDQQAPIPVCIQSISTSTSLPGGIIEIRASDFDLGSYDNCGMVSYYFKNENQEFVPDKRLDCNDISDEENEIEIFVVDQYGNAASCLVSLNITDPQNICQKSDQMIVGHIMNVNNTGLANAQIYIDDNQMITTNFNGRYALPIYDNNRESTISVHRDINPLEGVSLIDLILLQQKILGLIPYNSPFEVIASDINNDERISGGDVVALRRLLLGLDDTFVHNESWRFVHSDWPVNIEQAFPFMESQQVEEWISAGGSSLDFVGVKIGDLSGFIEEQKVATNRDKCDWTLAANDQWLEAGKSTQIVLKATTHQEIRAFLIEWYVKGVNITDVDTEYGQLDWRVENGSVTMLWSSEAAALKEVPALYITVVANQSIRLSESMKINTSKSISFITASHYDEIRVQWQPTELLLKQNTPNPFTKLTTIEYYIPESGVVELVIYNGLGRQIWSHTEEMEKGWHHRSISASIFDDSGAYYYHLQLGGQYVIKSMIMMK